MALEKIRNHSWQKSITIKAGQTKALSFDALKITFSFTNHSLSILYNYTLSHKQSQIVPVKTSISEIWEVEDSSITIHFKPCLPDRPYAIIPKEHYNIPAKDAKLLYVLVPCYIQLFIDGKSKTPLRTLPTHPLSKTWFGDPEEGELCFTLSTRLYNSEKGLPKTLNTIICPVKIQNKSDDHLYIEQFCFRVQYLSIYLHKNDLWSNLLSIVYQGVENKSILEFKNSPEIKSKNGMKLLLKPEKAPQKMTRKTFYELNYLKRFNRI